jgi:hypothetical protein
MPTIFQKAARLVSTGLFASEIYEKIVIPVLDDTLCAFVQKQSSRHLTQ